MALINKLTAIADAIREKTGTTDEMTLDAMASAIAGITTGSGGSGNNISCLDIKMPDTTKNLTHYYTIDTTNATELRFKYKRANPTGQTTSYANKWTLRVDFGYAAGANSSNVLSTLAVDSTTSSTTVVNAQYVAISDTEYVADVSQYTSVIIVVSQAATSYTYSSLYFHIYDFSLDGELVKPEGELSITENGTYDVTEYASAVVNVATTGGGGGTVNYAQKYRKTVLDDGTKTFDLSDTNGNFSVWVPTTATDSNHTQLLLFTNGAFVRGSFYNSEDGRLYGIDSSKQVNASYADGILTVAPSSTGLTVKGNYVIVDYIATA